MATKLVKKSAEYKIYQRGDKRYAVEDSNGKPVNGEAKVTILLAEDLIKVAAVAEPEPEVEAVEEVEEAVEAVEEAAEEVAEEAAEETTEESSKEA